MTQSNFFSLVDDVDDGDTIRVSVSLITAGVYCATIAGGWWMARGETPEKAVAAVVKQYERESR